MISSKVYSTHSALSPQSILFYFIRLISRNDGVFIIIIITITISITAAAAVAVHNQPPTFRDGTSSVNPGKIWFGA